MKSLSLTPCLLLTLLAAALPPVHAATIFTTDTLIGVNDTTHEGQDIVVSNAVLTVDGAHTFNSVRVAAGGMLTHSVSATGTLPYIVTITNELQVLTNSVTLGHPGIILNSVIVTDTNHLVIFTNDVDYVLTNAGVSVTLQRTTNSAIPDGDTVSVDYDYQTTVPAGLNLNVTTDVEIEPGASVNADARGFGGGSGPGAGASAGSPLSGGGGGYGGYGGLSSSNGAGGTAYGSPLNALIFGSGGGGGVGGQGGAGGGAIRLAAGNYVVLNGTVTVNGQGATNSRAGGGSGGRIYVNARTISGGGTVSAVGGPGEPIHGGGGGGGRIQLDAWTNNFTGDMLANGGAGWQRGGAGTISISVQGTTQVTMDNGGFAGAGTPLDSFSSFAELEIRGRATVVVPTGTVPNLEELLLRSNSTITTTATNNATLNLFVSGDVLIEAGAVVSLTGKGSPPNQGQGVGGAGAGGAGGQPGGGAGHGGYGGAGRTATATAAGGNYYGSVQSPTLPGSGGRTVGNFPGGAGGGAVRLTVNGKLQLDGTITVDGTAGRGTASGGASGGSVWLILDEFSGSGLISADGGSGGMPSGGGGAGGRIAMTCNSNSFAGLMTAFGGAGAVTGGAGTIYTRLNSSAFADLRVDNGGQSGTNTVSDFIGSHHLTVTGGAKLRPSATSPTYGTVQVGDNSIFFLGGNPGGVTASNVLVAAGGRISGDGSGFASGQGPGSGLPSSAGSTGGGHGGYGGRGAGFASSPGGNVYDPVASPSQAGSGGGSTQQAGGAGGAALRLNVSGALELNGWISANGNSALTNNSGGGAGGSLWLTLNQFSGSGKITADGGNGHLPNGGGGGGGRIAVYWNSNSFTGNYSAKAGNGFVPGGAGTIYLKANNAPTPSLMVDNGGLNGTNTLLDISGLRDLTVSGSASLVSTLSSLSVSNLTITSNAVLRVGNLTLTVSGAAIVGAGSGILADGFFATSGPGSGQPIFNGSSGAGHGGYGGRGAGTSFGGNVYDPTSTPRQPGSPGGGFNSGGGAGGGALMMTVSGPLVLDGKISANAFNATTNNGGGGSGGSILLNLNRISGSGLIAADGGNGHLPNGGGGGGGRVAVTWNTNLFTGKYSAKGGNGFQAGGAGTIYLKPNTGQFQTPSLLVDNGGLSGTNTTFDLTTLSNLTITGGATVRPTLSGTMNLTSLNIASNGTLQASTLNIFGPANIAAGGSISADGQGFPTGQGTFGGAGISSATGSGGGGHAGYGGRGSGGAAGGGIAAGGNAYDSLVNPTQLGSGGGGLNLAAGNGGGGVRITANGPFTLDGRISANGSPAITNGGGGGAGGYVWLSLNQFLGAGSITADGGSGHLPNGGGGGGGRIAVTYNYVVAGNQPPTNGFLGTMSAKGGSGFVKGGAGTVHVRTNNSVAQVLVDNGGTRGTNTLVSGTGSFDLTVRGGAVATSLGSPRDLFVRSNAWLATSPQPQSIFPITRNATFDAGGGIDLDGLGTSTLGSGMTFSTAPKGGGGHGGHGGLNAQNSGNVYDSAVAPTLSGSPGGNGSGTAGAGPFGGAGGGWAYLTVGQTLLMNGEISANGRNGEFNSGGGSGGGLQLQAITLAGNGWITATGGDGNGTAGGGGGGRIAIRFTTNLFTGIISACGGSGAVAGGAGTIYLQDNLFGLTSLLLDNCGLAGASTPLAQPSGLATNLIVTGSTVAEMRGAIPAFSNLVVSSGSFVTTRSADTNLYLALLGDLTVADGSGIIADATGFARSDGPGAGETLSNKGAGGGYGGEGGLSASGSLGGVAYGSATKPVDRGSGGGIGSGSPAAGSEGGGAIRLSVAGTLALDGMISSGGATGLQDDSGGGSGGSVWITAGRFTGHGALEATGGDGELFGGGGGGGGRIAVYSPMNTFTGLVSVAGGNGAFIGETGTVFTSISLGGLEVISQTPDGVVSNVVSNVLLEFSEPVNPLSVTPDDFLIYTPYGMVAQSNLTLAFLAPATLRVGFPVQNVPGAYRVEAGPAVTDLFGVPMSQVHTGAFSVTLPLISGTVRDTNGQPVAGVLLQPNGGLIATTTDLNGNYSLGVPIGWDGTVTPTMGGFAFVPGARSYTGISGDVTNQNYQLVASLAPVLQFTGSGTNLFLNWNAYTGITYQILVSTNLVDWLPFDPPIVSTNGPMQLVLPISDEPQKFFRLTAQN